MESAVRKGLVRLNRQRVELRKQSDFSQRVSKDDPNYELAQRFYLGAWADSHGLVAGTLAGQVSFPEWVESCINTFAQGAETQVAFVSKESIEEKCRELDRTADAFIHLFSEKVRATFEGSAKAVGENAIEHLTRSVRGIASRSQQQIYENALKEMAIPSPQDAGRTNGESRAHRPGNPTLPDTNVPAATETARAPRKRGRPTEISDELKEKALRVTGGKERAKILYQTRYPTPQQVKNVPTILKHFNRKRRPKAE